MTTPTITRVVATAARFSYAPKRPTPPVAVDTSWRRPEPVERTSMAGADHSCGDYLKYEEQE